MAKRRKNRRSLQAEPEAYARGDKVFVDFPHIDTLRRAPSRIDKQYPQLLEVTQRDEKHFIVLGSAKTRPMVVWGGDGKEYRLLKMTSSKPVCDHVELIPASAGGNGSYVETDRTHSLPARLITSHADRIHPDRMRQITYQMEVREGFRPPLPAVEEGTAGPC